MKYEKSPSFRIVFSLRDDSLYLLERSCAKIPALKVNRYNLRALDESSALDVIMKPCPDLFSDKEAREILDGLAYYEYDDYRVVDPAILSLFLYTYYQEQGKVSYSDIFGRYYKECTKDIKESSVAYIEDHLLTERGNRNQIPFDDIIAAGVAEGELELLLERKILKTEKRKGHDYAEFSHDRLCDQALKHREERKKSEQNRSFILRLLTMGMICILIIGIVVSFLRINYLHHDLQNTLETKLKYTQTINQNQSSLYKFLLRFFAQHHNYAYSADKLGGFIERAASNQGGQTSDNSLITQTGRVKVGQSYKYTFASKGHQELAVLAEPDGLITLRIHITNRAGLDSIYCDEQEDIKRGRPQRIVFFDLPADRRNNLELEVINCGQSDCNFVIISN